MIIDMEGATKRSPASRSGHWASSVRSSQRGSSQWTGSLSSLITSSFLIILKNQVHLHYSYLPYSFNVLIIINGAKAWSIFKMQGEMEPTKIKILAAIANSNARAAKCSSGNRLGRGGGGYKQKGKRIGEATKLTPRNAHSHFLLPPILVIALDL